uniref:Uncharacterized protein n=1 Tax=Eucampia antarctica TaxID=49252 RepID=A0A7S2VZZ5_9STRA|mmetsp:Transcript_15446/g.14877  ORF Transcript_15446/g.14877 Transcript_15446/m.14877 type:complete len:112 (+) Transcript_15446:309-644(+)
MDKDYYSKSKEGETQGTISVSPMSTITTSDSTKIFRLSNTLLNPTTESLKHIMKRSLGYWPSSPTQHQINKSNCQLHYWATGKRKYCSVAYCKDCKVSLCTDQCFEVSHSM